MGTPAETTVDPAEIERFSRIAAEWWDPAGKFAPLHRLNPVRIGYIRDRAAAHWQRDRLSGSPLKDVSLLDIGCGGGLLSEPMARLGARVTGVDAASKNVSVAAAHAEGQALAIAGAEYVLGWLPRGTHDWKKFLKPSEVVNGLRSGGIEAQEIVGVVYSPLSRAWSLSKSDLDVNYMLYGTKPGGT